MTTTIKQTGTLTLPCDDWDKFIYRVLHANRWRDTP
jgi:hypothetical protein